MKRRKFIVISSAGAAYAGLASCSFFGNQIEDRTLASPVFLHLIWDQETLSSIGASYARNFPDDDFKKQIDRLITENRSDTQAIKDKLRVIINSDFSQQETVMLDGWILSRTEARQCAVYNHLNQTNNNAY